MPDVRVPIHLTQDKHDRETMVENQRIVTQLQRRTAGTAIGSSTWRNMVQSGDRERARDFLSRLRLWTIPKGSQSEFNRRLEFWTDRLIERVSRRRGRNLRWGVARKGLNIFLQSCVNNWRLNEYHGLSPVHRYLELPLDSHTAKSLLTVGQMMDLQLPRWRGVIRLEEEDSIEYQGFASRLANANGMPRSDLDIVFWRNPVLDETAFRRTRLVLPR